VDTSGCSLQDPQEVADEVKRRIDDLAPGGASCSPSIISACAGKYHRSFGLALEYMVAAKMIDHWPEAAPDYTRLLKALRDRNEPHIPSWSCSADSR
jgi:hypothetical protein